MAILSVLLLFVTAALTVAYFVYKKKFQYWGSLGFPHTNPSFPMGDLTGIGTSKTFGEVVTTVYKNFQKEKLVGFWMLFKPHVLIRDPELIKLVLVRDFMTFHDRGIYVNEKDDPLAAHLFSIGGSKWRNLRVKLSPTFTSGKMKLMFPIIVECSKQLKNVLDAPARNGEVIEVKDFVARFTTDIISLAAFGVETNSIQKPNADFRYYGQKALEPSLMNTIRGLTSFLVPDIAQLLSLRFTDKECSDFFLRAIKETMDYRENNNVRRNDFMDLLIQLKNKGKLDDVTGETEEAGNDEKFTFEEAAAQAFVFFLAGFETSSTTIQFALYELAKNPEIQKKTREEIKNVLAKHNNEITYESISEMNYLSRVVDETLRIFPPVPFLQRKCNKDYQVSGTDLVVPGGTPIFIDVLGLHKDPNHYPNPEQFDPDRFTEQAKSKRHHYAYLPFGEGPRNCIGMRFGLMQTKVGMTMLLTNYEFSVVSETPIPVVFDPKSFVLQPKGGMNLKITKI